MNETTMHLRRTLDNLIQTAQFDTLMDTSKMALVDARKHNDKIVEALSLLGLAESHKFIGKFTEALLLTDGALNIAQVLPDEHLKAQTYLIRASIHLMGTYQIHEAETDYREALAIAHDIQDHYTVAQALAGVGAAFNQQRNLPQAEEFAREALRIANELNEPYLIVHTLNILGTIHGNSGRTDEALKVFQKAVEMAQIENFRVLEVALITNIGQVLVQQGRYSDEGQQMLEKALRMAQEISHIPEQFTILFWMGRSAEIRGDTEQAGEHYNTMLIRSQEWQTRAYEGIAFFNLGILAFNRQHYDDAVSNLDQSLMIARETKNPYQEAQIEQVLGATYSRLQDWDSTLDHYMAARTLYDALDNHQMVNQMMQAILMTYLRRFVAQVLSWLGIGKERDSSNTD